MGPMVASKDPMPARSSRWQPRFGLTKLMLVTVVFCVMGTAGYQRLRAPSMVRILGVTMSPKAVFVLFTLAAPMLLLTALSCWHQLLSWLERSSNRKEEQATRPPRSPSP